jgi:acyl-CoA reductase-like NAD-dependent aldehyde dehydrogenase
MLTKHNDVKKLSFTGSTETGIRIVKEAADTLKKVTMELGGKSPLLIFEDANIDNAVSAAMMSNWYTQGEICSNATRVFVHKSIKEEVSVRGSEGAREEIEIGRRKEDAPMLREFHCFFWFTPTLYSNHRALTNPPGCSSPGSSWRGQRSSRSETP